MNVCRWGTKLPPAECRAGESGAYFQALEFVDRHLPSDEALRTGKPASAYYFTGRQTIPLGRAIGAGHESFLDVRRQHGAQYLVLGRLQPNEHHSLARLLAANCEALSLEAAFQPQTLVLRVPDPGALAAHREIPVRGERRAEP